MYVDFIDLNITYPKDLYHPPNIDGMIDRSLSYKMMSFMDAYSRYNHIKMGLIDAPKMAFMSNHNNYYYNIMPFRIKNVGTTYQRLMDAVFFKKLRHNLEVYIDGMIVKT